MRVNVFDDLSVLLLRFPELLLIISHAGGKSGVRLSVLLLRFPELLPDTAVKAGVWNKIGFQFSF